MMPVVFIIGVLNLVLGFGLAILLERQIVVPVPLPRFQPTPGSDDVLFEIPALPTVGDDIRKHLPRGWVELLNTMDLQCSTIIEATVEVLKLEVAGYRANLLDVEEQMRITIDGDDPDAASRALENLIALNDEWVTKQWDALKVVAEKRDCLGEYIEEGKRLESLLLDQTSLIEDHCNAMKNLDVKTNASAADTITCCMGDLVRMAHELRDAVEEASLSILRNEGRLLSSDRQQRQDALTGMQNRISLEVMLENWWREDLNPNRLSSAALIDLDRFGELNNRFGTRAGDQILNTVARYLEQLTSRESELDRAFRYGGQSFFLFFGETGTRGAFSNLERIRQTMEATTLEYHGERFTLTVRAGLTQVRSDDDTASLCQRVEELAETAKRAGRNQTCVADAASGGIAEAESMPVNRRLLKVESSPA